MQKRRHVVTVGHRWLNCQRERTQKPETPRRQECGPRPCSLASTVHAQRRHSELFVKSKTSHHYSSIPTEWRIKAKPLITAAKVTLHVLAPASLPTHLSQAPLAFQPLSQIPMLPPTHGVLPRLAPPPTMLLPPPFTWLTPLHPSHANSSIWSSEKVSLLSPVTSHPPVTACHFSVAFVTMLILHSRV